MMKDDYESQTTTYKNGNVVKNHWRDNMVGFSEVVISFGTERDKEPKEGLNSTEVNFINAKVSLDRVQRFANLYCAKYNVKCLLIAEHNDEKTRHYQLIFTNYLLRSIKILDLMVKERLAPLVEGYKKWVQKHLMVLQIVG